MSRRAWSFSPVALPIVDHHPGTRRAKARQRNLRPAGLAIALGTHDGNDPTPVAQRAEARRSKGATSEAAQEIEKVPHAEEDFFVQGLHGADVLLVDAERVIGLAER